MKYSSLQEYFYKLHSVLYMLVLLPLLASVFLYVYQPISPVSLSAEEKTLLCGVLAGVSIVDSIVGSLIFNSRIKAMRSIPSLGLRLEKYYLTTIVRFSLFAFADLLLVGGFFLTEYVLFIWLFCAGLILFLLVWPRSGKVCSDLKLKGDEREMVYHKKMNLYS